MSKYEKLRLVGRGAFGTVFLCKRITDGKHVILKEIPVDQMSVEERQASVNEAKVLSMLDHPNIVSYYESYLEDKTMTIVMEFVQGGTLFDFLKSRSGKLLDEKEVLHYFGQMVYTLQYVHKNCILHRDLKSQNILLNNSKTIIKIGDFGISKVLTTKSKAYTVVGTPCYISPELCEGKPYKQKSDIWALGCILYELMTLKRPFDAETLPALVMKIMKGNFDPTPDVYSYELKKLLTCMLHLDPDQRPSASEIMCQPFMINMIFHLYVEIGSIPTNQKGRTCSFKSSDSDSSDESDLLSDSVGSDDGFQNVWFFQLSCPEGLLLPPVSEDIKSISLGSNQKTCVTEKRHLVSWNVSAPMISVQNEFKAEELIRTSTYVVNFIDEKFAINISSVASGDDFTACLSDIGVVYTFGTTASGCLGYIAEKDVSEPKIVETLFGHNVTSIACGPKHVLAVSEESEVFAWGQGTYGCLGLGPCDDQVLPQLVDVPCQDEKPIKVFCGFDCSFIITDQMSLLACGSNRHNKLAMDSSEGHQSDECRVFAPVKSDPLPRCKILSVCSGKSHSLILCDNGELYSVGSNQYYQLGWGQIGINYSMPDKVTKLEDSQVSQIACSSYYSLALTNDNYLFCWGKCPKPFVPEGEICFVETPLQFKRKIVECIACDAENCIVVTKGSY